MLNQSLFKDFISIACSVHQKLFEPVNKRLTPIESFMLKLDFQSCLVIFGGKDLSTTSQNVFYEGVFND
ncbi:hypothetical protein HMPREF9999_01914 [Alloprevotella sp. oral taxon 473 str. F0040]|nr:hypothetical protein HMPREF9999_01914 [Alloprevotella sp. oral taxon 473 str. F0040]